MKNKELEEDKPCLLHRPLWWQASSPQGVCPRDCHPFSSAKRSRLREKIQSYCKHGNHEKEVLGGLWKGSTMEGKLSRSRIVDGTGTRRLGHPAINFLWLSPLHNQQLYPLQHDWERQSRKFTARKYNDFARWVEKLLQCSTINYFQMSLHNQQLSSLYLLCKFKVLHLRTSPRTYLLNSKNWRPISGHCDRVPCFDRFFEA